VQRLEHRFTAMGGPCAIRVDCDDEGAALAAIARAEAEVRRLEGKYSRYREDSLLSEINRLAGTGEALSVDAETAGLLHYAQTLWEQSNGLFDPTSGVLRRAWDFRSGRLPEPSEIDRWLSLVGWERVCWNGDSIALEVAGMELDLGGCVKEYAADAAAAALAGAELDHALVDLAGDMACTGGQADGAPWRIGIRNPTGRRRAAARLDLPLGGIASSGDYERCIEIDGRRYGHILDPRTGWPVEGLVAVSVAAPQCLVAGSFATLAMLRPERDALDWLATLELPWLAVQRGGEVRGSLLLSG
jgi:thiamine biosynthesis lipoprotein